MDSKDTLNVNQCYLVLPNHNAAKSSSMVFVPLLNDEAL